MVTPLSLPVSDVMGVKVAVVSVSEFMSWLVGQVHAENPAPSFITYLNAACSNIAADDAGYHDILNQAECVYADGQAIVWASRVLGNPLPERVNAGDFIVDLCRQLADAEITIGLIGGRETVAAQAASSWAAEASGLKVAGAWSGFQLDSTQVSQIASVAPDILLVGMGVPLQEHWAWTHKGLLGAKVIWCVGALFEYYGEGRPRAPVWVRRFGLEWLFRLALEPRRLWRRYLLGNARFIWRLARQRLFRQT